MATEPEVFEFPGDTSRENVEQEKQFKLEDGAKNVVIEKTDDSWIMKVYWKSDSGDRPAGHDGS